MNRLLTIALTLILVSTRMSFSTSSDTDSMIVSILSDKNMFNTADKIAIKFEVMNTTNEAITFCKYQTPFEGFTAGYMLITNLDTGEELRYRGILIKRTKPGKEDYITVEANKAQRCELILTDSYSFEKAGTYSIQFIGNPLNMLPNSNILTIDVKQEE
ncbi:MAG: hypothetical protein JXB49_03995 [Bacteroidales bacterium]|nr:hypothetical protein [Bacteroidales bacterium]